MRPAEDCINTMTGMFLAIRTALSPRKGTAMFRSIFLLVLVLLASSYSTYAQREIEKEEIKKVEKSPAPTPRQAPKGKRFAQRRTNGVLFVLTEPVTADVMIKNGRGEILKQEASDNGELRAELPQGTYIIEVTAAKYYPRIVPGVSVSPSQARTVKAYLNPTTGSVIIGLGQVESEATTVLIDEQQPSSLKVRVNINKEENQIELDDVPEGIHTMSITNPNIADWRREKVRVKGGVTITLAPRFQMAVVNLAVKSEPGAEIYIDGAMVGKTLDNGELRIADKYKPGQHIIRAEKSFFEPAQEVKNLVIGDQVVEVKLTHTKSSPEFSEEFREGLKFWDAPSSWQLNRRTLTVRGSEAGLVKSANYVDFKMQLDIGFTNGKGAVWIIRARDKKNFYLFQLCGPKGASPKSFRSYVYKNGQPTMLNSTNMLEDLTRPEDIYTITIEAKGSTIRHLIQLKSKPAAGSQIFSTLIDSTFPYGTVGLGTVEGEEFVVHFLNITPN